MFAGPIGKFLVLGTLGQGANSTILHVRRSRDAAHYALKVVPIDGAEDLKYLEQARHEFRVAQMLSHPGLLKIHALETPRDWLFRIVKVHMLAEFIDGTTLDAAKHMTLPRLVQVFERVAAAMVHMHRRGVCHADLKPNNIMLSRKGEVKVIDFGLAWIHGERKERLQGTPEYIAPEQVLKGTVDEHTDIFNFGATMYRLVTWRLPPSAAACPHGLPMDAKTFRGLLKPVDEFRPEAPPPLCDLIHSCLNFHPHKRPERMSEIHAVLSRLSEALVVSEEDRLGAADG